MQADKIYSGIDEAGYGPVIGPFTCASFESPYGADFWGSRLDIFRGNKGKGLPLVNDSKVLNRGKKTFKGYFSSGFAELEKTVLALYYTACGGRLPENAEKLADMFYGGDKLPYWSGAADVRLPVACGLSGALSAGKALKGSVPENSMMIAARIMYPGEINAALEKVNKTGLVKESFSYLIKRTLMLSDGDAEFECGKMSGTVYYGGFMKEMFPGRGVRAEKESVCLSSYGVEAHRGVKISFILDGDSSSFRIALASMLAKYIRDILTYSMNLYFQKHKADIAFSKGYSPDGLRFAADTKEIRYKLGIKDWEFIRNK